jgi:hypothetical protein
MVWPENEVKTTLLAFLGCLYWDPFIDPEQQGDKTNESMQTLCTCFDQSL